MWNFFGPMRRCRGTGSRRDVLRVGGLGFTGLTLADVPGRRANAGTSAPRSKSVIMIWLRGGALHIDSFDMKPDAPAEVRGEFHPIPTNVPGIPICKHLPLLAGILDKLAIVRGIKSNDLGDHTPHYIITGSPGHRRNRLARWPSQGSPLHSRQCHGQLVSSPRHQPSHDNPRLPQHRRQALDCGSLLPLSCTGLLCFPFRNSHLSPSTHKTPETAP